MNNKMVIIDGNSLLFRAYYATSYAGPDKIMRTKTGIPTNAIFAFANMIVKIINDLGKDDELFVAFDTGEKTFRHDQFDDYKAHRKPAPEDLVPQFAIAREFLDVMGIFHYELNGYEADDIAGTIAKKCEQNGKKVIIYTSDQDYLQLISDNVTVNIIKRGLSDVLSVTPLNIVSEYGFKAAQVSDYKGLTGDASDNIPGIPGVGKVTALKLLNEYENLENILANQDSIKGKVGESIREFASVAIKSKDLATIITTLDLPIIQEDFKYRGYDYSQVNAFSEKYELRQFIRNLKVSSNGNEEQIEIKRITSTQNIKFGNSLSFYFSFKSDIYFEGILEDAYFFVNDTFYVISGEDLLVDLNLITVLGDENVKKYTYDYKAAYVYLASQDIALRGLEFDLQVAAYLLDSNIPSNINGLLTYFALSPRENAEENYALLAKISFTHVAQIKKALSEINNFHIYEQIEKPLITVLAKMELEGISVDATVLNDLGKLYEKEIEAISEEILQYSNEIINLNSPQQVATLLYDQLKLKANKKRSTAVEYLEQLKDEHPVVPLLLKHRKYAKIMSTYIEGLIPHIFADKKIHTSFNQALTTTGRLSSKNPNLQNISIRANEGREIRKAFKEENAYLLSIDYSQVELRLLASLAKEDKFIENFKKDIDIHLSTGKSLFPHEEDDVARQKAKAVNFGIVYGISSWGLADQISVHPAESDAIIKKFFVEYPKLWEYRENIIKTVQKEGYVETILGRRRYLPQINDSNFQVREFAKRAAMNAPIQGSASDLIKIAMINVDKYLSDNHLKSKLLVQIHDELLFKLDENEKHIIPHLVKIMEEAIKLDVPLKVNASYGRTWFDAS